MQSLRTLGVAALAALAAGCRTSQAAGDETSHAETVRADSQRVVLPANSAQLKSLTIAAVRPPSPDSVRLPGRVVWNEDATVRVFSPFAGRVVSVLVDLGRSVHAGDTLALIAAPDFGQVQADARRAAADLAQAERTAARAADLVEHGVAPRKDLEAAQADVTRARAEADRANARLAQYGGGTTGVDQSFALRAPITGVVVDRSLSPGQEVRPDQMLANAPQLFAPLFTITDPSRLWVLVDASERDAADLHAGSTVRVHSDALTDDFPATLGVVGGAVDPNTRTVKARVVVPNPQGRLKAEMMVSVVLARADRPSVRVPSGAVLIDGAKHVVFVAEAPGTFRRQEVTIGGERDGYVSIRAGLTATDHVVADGALLVEQLYRR
jgi:cobalt-zinc-cadmium efflux system membrane fusion protein